MRSFLGLLVLATCITAASYALHASTVSARDDRARTHEARAIGRDPFSLWWIGTTRLALQLARDGVEVRDVQRVAPEGGTTGGAQRSSVGLGGDR